MKWKCSFKLFVILVFLLSTSFLYSHDFDWGSINLFSNTKYVYQWSDKPNDSLVSDDDNDQDISEILGIDAVHKKSGISFSFLGKYAKDLDGTPEGSIFQDYIDTGRNRQKLDVYYAYFEKENVFTNVDFKLGRQYAYSSEVVHYDGASVSGEGAIAKWFNFEIFGGQIVQTYSNLDQDGVSGINLEFKPVKNLLLYVDSVFYQENSYEIGAYYMPADNIKLKGNFAFINDSSRSWNIDIIATCPYAKTTVTIDIFKRFTIPVDDDFLYDYTTSIEENIGKDIKRFYLARLYGYIDYSISLSQPIPKQEGMTFYVKYTRRNINDDYENAYENLYNTDFYRWSLGLNLDNWWKLKGTKFSLGYSYWKEDKDNFYDSSSESWYADLEQEISETFSFSGGFYYKTEDVNSLIEGEASHYYYGSLKYKFAEEKWVSLKYEYETDDYYHEFGISGVNAITANIHLTW
jgi:hypothetical protein